MEISSDGWSYRAEGNNSIVVCNFKRKVVCRIIKSKLADEGNTSEKKTDAVTNVKNQLEFVDAIMKPVIGQSYIVPMKLVSLTDDFIASIREAILPDRPEYRRLKDIPTGCHVGVLMPDLCALNSGAASCTYSLEIKPKWGYLPTNSNVADVKRSVCRYCMHQYIKVSSGKWQSKSNYCPIDLFSGCPARIRCAIQQLFETPQNNLRLFKNGIEIWSDRSKNNLDLELSAFANSDVNADGLVTGSVDELVDLVTSCLLHDDVISDVTMTSSHVKQLCSASLSLSQHVCLSECPALPSGSVLSRILTAQRLDDLDNEGLYPVYCRVRDYFQAEPGSRLKSRIDGPYSVDWLVAPSGESVANSIHVDILKVKQYLISRSAKDCSVFITIQHVKNSTLTSNSPCASSCADTEAVDRQFVIWDRYGRLFNCCLSIIDLDPKSFDKIPFYLEEDQDVVKHYLNCADKSANNY